MYPGVSVDVEMDFFVVVADELCTYKFWTYINIGVHMYLFML